VLRAAGETETTQEGIQDWLKLDEGEPGLQLLFFKQGLSSENYLFSSVLPLILNFAFICFLIFLSFRAIFDRLCGLVVRVSGYRSRGPGFDSQPYQIF
jgi:hypothetical protein